MLKFLSGEGKDLNSFGGGSFNFVEEVYMLAGSSATYMVADVKGNYTKRYFEQGKVYDGKGITNILDASSATVAVDKITLRF